MPTVNAEAPAATKTSNPPVQRFSHRGVHLSIFENESNGRKFYSTTLECRYKDKNDDWQTGHSFDDVQLAVLSDLADDARRFIRGLRAQEKAENA